MEKENEIESKHVPGMCQKEQGTNVVGLDNREAEEMNSKIH